MSKVWVLETDTKGTGARMVPLDQVLAKPEPAPERPRPRPAVSKGSGSARPRKPRQPVETSATPLPPGHVRKKATGEIGRVRSVDAKAGTATVQWLKEGRTSSVPLAALSRR
jgi:hypothetical protein